MFGIGWNVHKDECQRRRKSEKVGGQFVKVWKWIICKDVPFMLHFACINAGLPGQADTEA